MTINGDKVLAEVPIGESGYLRVLEWLTEEADVLDRRQHERWLEMLSPELVYQAPVREADQGDTSSYFHYDESYASISLRIARALLPSSWIDSPPIRTRRFISGVRVQAVDDILCSSNNLLVVCNRNDSTSHEMISCGRSDTYRPDSRGNLQLIARTILLDQINLGVSTLSVFL